MLHWNRFDRVCGQVLKRRWLAVTRLITPEFHFLPSQPDTHLHVFHLLLHRIDAP
jgi:hypothetical protein